MTDRYLMKCGHADNAINGKTGEPACAICTCFEIDHKITDPKEGLEGRMAVCDCCDNTVPSEWLLPFFSYNPKKDHDRYYCGCRGWD